MNVVVEKWSARLMTVLVSFSCQLDTAWSHLKEPQLRDCVHQASLAGSQRPRQ